MTSGDDAGAPLHQRLAVFGDFTVGGYAVAMVRPHEPLNNPRKA
jgi:hypothetical protein